MAYDNIPLEEFHWPILPGHVAFDRYVEFAAKMTGSKVMEVRSWLRGLARERKYEAERRKASK